MQARRAIRCWASGGMQGGGSGKSPPPASETGGGADAKSLSSGHLKGRPSIFTQASCQMRRHWKPASLLRRWVRQWGDVTVSGLICYVTKCDAFAVLATFAYMPYRRVMGFLPARRYKEGVQSHVPPSRSQIMKLVVAALLAVTLAGCVVVPARPYYGGGYGHRCCYRY